MAVSTSNNNILLIFVLAIASSFSPLSVDLFAPLMPDATRNLATSAEAMQASLYIFLIGYGVSPFLWGTLTDRLGRRSIMLAGIIIYMLASVGCFLSDGILELSLYRFVQGGGAASAVVVARAVLRDIHGPTGATKAISSMFLIMVWVPILGPVIGGFLTDFFQWRISFLLMASIAALTLVGSYLWQAETLPETVRDGDAAKYNGLRLVIMSPIFLRNALSNMFCIANMVLFVTNYSYFSESYYQLSASENGYVLAVFNGGLSAGVYLVRLVTPRLGVESTVFLGLWLSLIGWVALWIVCLNEVPPPFVMLSFVVLACLGTGMAISLTVGQALVPFTYAAGAASALFVFFQSAGSSLISFLATLVAGGALTTMSMALVLCSLFAMASMKFIKAEQ